MSRKEPEPDHEPSKDHAQSNDAGRPRLGPITDAAFTGDTATALEREWNEALRDQHGYVLLWAGAYSSPETPQFTTHWSWLQTHLEAEPEQDEHDEFAPLLAPSVATWTERLLSPLAHEARIRIMQALWAGPIGSSALSDATGLVGGNLYYHLKELIHARYVGDQHSKYALTGLGRQLLVTLALIATEVVGERAHEGAMLRTVWAHETDLPSE